MSGKEPYRTLTEAKVDEPSSMIFLVFTVLAFIVLRLTFRMRWRTLLLLAVLAGLVGDAIIDLVIARRS